MPATNKISTVPAPIGGLNARDSLAAMPPTDAYVLVNFWPQPYGVAVRKGYKLFAELEDSESIDTMAVWNSIDGSEKIFAWAGEDFWDITAGGTPVTPEATGLANSFWQYTNMSNAAGSHLIAVNGVDDGILYSEDGIHRLVAGDGVTPYTWNGLDPVDAISVTIHQARLWAVKKNSSSGFYLPLDALYGDLDEFDFGPKFPRGGYLSFLTTWTIDDGNGAEDHLVAVSSTGSAVVYSGINVADPETWQLVGVYDIGPPVLGRKSFAKVGGDLYILTSQGVVSMSSMLSSTKVNDQKLSFPSYKIQYLLSNLITQFGELSNWQLGYVPDLNMLICNVPTVYTTGSIQLVANQIISAWGQFTGMNAASWVVFQNGPYFGTFDGKVYSAWNGYLDNVDSDGTGGTSVIAYAAQAYSYLDSLGTQKQVGMYRPTFIVGNKFGYNSAINYDFKNISVQVPDGLPLLGDFGVWDESYWDEAIWYGGTGTYREWRQAQGIGVAAALAIATASNGETLWVSTDYSYKVGGVL